MKFANYRFRAKGVNNLGDQMQIIAIDEVYRRMGIPQGDIVYLDTQELDRYDGEYVILPVTMPLVDYREGGISGRFSRHIIPVFLGLTMVKQTLEPEEVAYLRQFEPIGCRDEWALNTLRNYHIRSYLHGCITVTLPPRECQPRQGEVYLVDVSPELLPLIPDRLREGAQLRSHLISELLSDPKAAALAQYREYKDNARLVITSLLHCAVPCLAAGIPVVLLKEKVSYRMAWLEKILPVYTEETLRRGADWSGARMPQDHQKRILDLTVARLRQAYERNAPLYDLSYFYEDRVKSEYINDACHSLRQFVDENWKDPTGAYRYSVWGLTQISEWLIGYISGKYPNAKLCHVYDSFRTVQLAGLQSQSPDHIAQAPDETVFVTTNGAEAAARELFGRIGKPEGTYAFVKVVR